MEPTKPTYALLCEDHGVCRAGFRKKACYHSCTILRSDYCQEHVPFRRNWGFVQCSRPPVAGGQGYCTQHSKMRNVTLTPEQVEQVRAEWAERFFRPVEVKR